jgi:hypothetical protein
MASSPESSSTSSSSNVVIAFEATTAKANGGFTSKITTYANTNIPITISIEDDAVAISTTEEGVHATSATATATTSGSAFSPTVFQDTSNDECHKTSSSIPHPLTATTVVDLTTSPLKQPGTTVEPTENKADPGPKAASTLPTPPVLDTFDLKEKPPPPRWKIFQQKDHSLRISASEVAALAGFHPFRSLPKVLLDHVYQGHEGQELLRHDATLLDLTLISEEEQLLQLAQLAGPSTSQAVQVALQVKRGTTKLQTCQHASQLQKEILHEAQKSKKLSVAQLKQLQEGTRYSVNTGFGTTWETNALDVYERQCGWDIYERNGEIRTWSFCKVTDHSTGQPTVIPKTEAAAASATYWKSGGSTTSRSLRVETMPPKRRKRDSASSPDEKVVDLTESDDNAMTLTIVNDDNNRENKVELGQDGEPRAMTPIVSSETELPFFSLRGSVDGIRDELVPNQLLERAVPLQSSSTGRPSPSIDEGNKDDDDDSWVLQRIIVECKHRMTRIQPSPPLYEQIQATAYCLMFEAECADIVQVLRKRGVVRSREDYHVDENDRLGQDSQKLGTKLLNSPSKSSNVSSNPLTNYFPMKESQIKESSTALLPNDRHLNNPQIRTEENADVELDRSISWNNAENLKTAPPLTNSPVQEAGEVQTVDSKELLASDINTSDSEPKTNVDDALSTQPETTKDKENDPKVPLPPQRRTTQLEISVHRVFLDDPVLQHRHNWHQVILPRLRSWVDAVYSIRNNDDKRYRLLLAMSRNDPPGTSEAWQHLFEECSWLKGCDTAFLRDTSENANW